jgi:hypothetical protein
LKETRTRVEVPIGEELEHQEGMRRAAFSEIDHNHTSARPGIREDVPKLRLELGLEFLEDLVLLRRHWGREVQRSGEGLNRVM